MGLGGAWDAPTYGPTQLEVAARAVETALSIGIRRFDHADIYSRGKSEAVFGELLAQDPELRSRISIQSKVGIRLAHGEGFGYYDLSRAAIIDGVTDTLRRLQTNYLDLLLLHRPDPLLDPVEVGRAIAELHEGGVIRGMGVSNMSAQQIDALQDYLPIPLIANQLELSLRNHGFVDSGVLVNHGDGAAVRFPHGTVEHCVRSGIELQAWAPLAGGAFTRRPTGARSDTERATSRLVAELASAKGVAPEAIVLGWLMRHPAQITPVIGSTNPARIRASADADIVAKNMTRAEWFELFQSARGARIP